eukprot:2635030-Amphidinium_carterae.2
MAIKSNRHTGGTTQTRLALCRRQVSPTAEARSPSGSGGRLCKAKCKRGKTLQNSIRTQISAKFIGTNTRVFSNACTHARTHERTALRAHVTHVDVLAQGCCIRLELGFLGACHPGAQGDKTPGCPPELRF